MCMMCIGVVAFLGFGLVCSQDMQGGKASRDPVLSGMVFTENLLFEQTRTSKIGCASLCLKTDLCVTFTFTPVTSADDVCRGHSARMNSSHAHQASIGTNLYAFRDGVKNGRVAEKDWLNTTCARDEDCSQPNSRCRRQGCTCIQGYYFSVSTKACLESCSAGDLQDTYLVYPNAVTVGDGGTFFGFVSREACRQGCTDASDCLFFERGDSSGDCWLETETPRDKPAEDWRDDYPEWTYDQKNCR